GLLPLDDVTPAGWTYKGMLSHVAYWMEQVPAEMPNRLAGRRGSAPDVDRENEREAKAGADQSADEVLQRLDTAYRTVIEMVKALPQDRDVPFLAVRLVVGETYGHFVEHGAEVEAALPKTAARMLERFDDVWRRFRAALRERGRAGLGETTSAGWTYRDLAAHAAAWMQEAAREIDGNDITNWNKDSIQAFNDRAVGAGRRDRAAGRCRRDRRVAPLRGAQLHLPAHQRAHEREGSGRRTALWRRDHPGGRLARPAEGRGRTSLSARCVARGDHYVRTRGGPEKKRCGGLDMAKK